MCILHMEHILLSSLISLIDKKKIGMPAAKPNKGLEEIIKMIESKGITPVIDKRFSLSEAPEALRYLGEGHAKAKIVVNL